MSVIQILREVILAVFLGWNTYLDIRWRRISMLSVCAAGVLGVMLGFYEGSLLITDFILGLLPGLVVFLLAQLTREEIGYGDGWGLIVTGIFLGGADNLRACMTAVLLAGMWALMLLVLFHKNRKYEIPFLPFLLCGVLSVRWLM